VLVLVRSLATDLTDGQTDSRTVENSLIGVIWFDRLTLYFTCILIVVFGYLLILFAACCFVLLTDYLLELLTVIWLNL